MSKYYATSPTTVKIPITDDITNYWRKFYKFIEDQGFFVEYNSKIGMYRLNGKDLPDELMGYELHLPICMKRLKQYLRKKDARQ